MKWKVDKGWGFIYSIIVHYWRKNVIRINNMILTTKSNCSKSLNQEQHPFGPWTLQIMDNNLANNLCPHYYIKIYISTTWDSSSKDDTTYRFSMIWCYKIKLIYVILIYAVWRKFHDYNILLPKDIIFIIYLIFNKKNLNVKLNIFILNLPFSNFTSSQRLKQIKKIFSYLLNNLSL